jgi:hypothetical protein
LARAAAGLNTMSQLSASSVAKAAPVGSAVSLLQRKCACGSSASELTGECDECRSERLLGMQRRPVVGGCTDPLEAEADRAADRVIAMPGSALELSQIERPVLSRFVAAGSVGASESVPADVHHTLQSAGDTLPPELRGFFEPRFGHDFGNVRIHRDAAAARSADAVQALAYTVGPHVVFAEGAYAPSTARGRTLLAHELAHVVQQSHGRGQLQRQAQPAPGAAQGGGGRRALDSALQAIRVAAPLVPGLAPLAASIELVRGAIYFYEHREEHLAQLLAGIDTAVQGVPALAQAKLQEFLRSVGRPAAEATACIGDQLLLFLQSLADNWRGVLESFLRDLVFVGLFERSIPSIIRNVEGLVEELGNGNYRAAIDRGVAIMTEINAIAGVIFLWYALITTVVGGAAGSEVPVAGNAAGAAAGLTLAQVVNIALVASVVATEGARVARGIDEMVRRWDDLPGREAGCRQVAEGVFALALTAALFYLGPGIQRVARSIIGQAATAVRRAATSLSRDLAAAPRVVTPEGLVLPFSGPTPEPVVPRPPVARGPRPGTTRPPQTVAEPRPPTPEPAPEARPRVGPATRLAPAGEDPTRRVDRCKDLLNLSPGIDARWHSQRAPIGGHTTVLAAAFRLDAGRPPPPGQVTTPNSRLWARAIGLPADDAGHVIARRFGGTALFNGPDGNIFPQNLTVNRGRMVIRDREAAQLHAAGCDVCVHLRLNYALPSDLRPSEVVHTIISRAPGAPDFTPPSPPQAIPNP